MSPVYVDAVVERDRDSDGDSSHTLDERLYVAQDANWNVTSIFDAAGVTKEHFQYTSYGTQAALSSSWSSTFDAYPGHPNWTSDTPGFSLQPLSLYSCRSTGATIYFGMYAMFKPTSFNGVAIEDAIEIPIAMCNWQFVASVSSEVPIPIITSDHTKINEDNIDVSDEPTGEHNTDEDDTWTLV